METSKMGRGKSSASSVSSEEGRAAAAPPFIEPIVCKDVYELSIIQLILGTANSFTRFIIVCNFLYKLMTFDATKLFMQES